jgi:hypothetical protein
MEAGNQKHGQPWTPEDERRWQEDVERRYEELDLAELSEFRRWGLAALNEAARREKLGLRQSPTP